MTSPSLTIAIPTLNRCALLKRAVESALKQDLPVEVIISDNGSSDGTAAYLAGVSTERARLRKFRRDDTISAQQHGEFIKTQITTDWLVMLHDDDYLETDFTSKIYQLVLKRPDIRLAYTGCDILYGQVATPARVGPEFEPTGDFLLEFMRGNREICMCCTAYRMDDLRRIGPQPESVAIGDMFYWTKILSSPGTVGCAPGRHATYRMYEAGHRSETNRTRAGAWIRESRELARAISCAVREQTRQTDREVATSARRYLSITSANHIIWQALRGSPRTSLILDVVQNLDVLISTPAAAARALGATLLPRAVLESIVLSAARARAAPHIETRRVA